MRAARLQAEVDAGAAEQRARATYATTASLRLGFGASVTLIWVSVFAWIVIAALVRLVAVARRPRRRDRPAARCLQARAALAQRSCRRRRSASPRCRARSRDLADRRALERRLDLLWSRRATMSTSSLVLVVALGRDPERVLAGLDVLRPAASCRPRRSFLSSMKIVAPRDVRRDRRPSRAYVFLRHRATTNWTSLLGSAEIVDSTIL